MSSVLRVCVSGAAGQIAYSLLPMIANGSVFGADQKLALHLLDITPAMGALGGVVMELNDSAYPLVQEIIPTDDLKTAFSGVHAVILLGGFPRRKGMLRSDLLAKNSPIFVGQGKAINDYADKDVRVLVVANPANTNCLVAAQNAPDLPKSSFSALTRLDLHRARHQIAARVGTTVANVNGVAIWGNHSKTMVPDVSLATVTLDDGKEQSVADAVNDKEWLQGEFVSTVQQRGAAVIAARGNSSATSAARAAAEHMRNVFQGTAEGEHVSMGVWSKGDYGVAKDIVFSFPVTIKDKEWKVVEGFSHDDFTKAAIAATEKELLEEKAEALKQ